MKIKEILLKQFTIALDENGWFVALKNTVNNLSAKDAVWKPDGAAISDETLLKIKSLADETEFLLFDLN